MPRRARGKDLEPPFVAVSEADVRDANVRLALAKTYVGLMRATRELYPRASLADIFVLHAVSVGTLQERPMNAFKISIYTGLPHQTVGRRLNSLLKLGYVARKARKRFVTKQLPPITDAFIKQFAASLTPALHIFDVQDGQFRKSETGDLHVARSAKP